MLVHLVHSNFGFTLYQLHVNAVLVHSHQLQNSLLHLVFVLSGHLALVQL